MAQPQIHKLEDHNYSFPTLLEKYQQLILTGQLKAARPVPVVIGRQLYSVPALESCTQPEARGI